MGRTTALGPGELEDPGLGETAKLPPSSQDSSFTPRLLLHPCPPPSPHCCLKTAWSTMKTSKFPFGPLLTSPTPWNILEPSFEGSLLKLESRLPASTRLCFCVSWGWVRASECLALPEPARAPQAGQRKLTNRCKGFWATQERGPWGQGCSIGRVPVPHTQKFRA